MKKTYTNDLRIAIVFTVLAIPILCGLTYMLGLTSPARTTFYRNYKALKMGMPKAEVQALYGESPAYACRLIASEIWYYAAPGRLTGKFPDNTPQRGELYGSAKDLPNVYGHIQLAFDTNNEVIAFTFIGESATVESRGGSVKGSHFKCLRQQTNRNCAHGLRTNL